MNAQTTIYLVLVLTFIFSINLQDDMYAQEKTWSFGLDLGGRSGLIDIKDGDNSAGFSTFNESRALYGLRVQRNLSEQFAITAVPSFSELAFSMTTGEIDPTANVPNINSVNGTDVEIRYLFMPVMATWKLATKPEKGKGWELSAGIYSAFKISESGFTVRRENLDFFAIPDVQQADFRFFDTGIHYEFRRFQPILGIKFNFFVSTSIGVLNLQGSDGQDGLNNHTINYGIGYRF